MNSIFGNGFVFPLQMGVNGRLKTSEGEARIWDSVQTIMQTPRGTRPMDPDFGFDAGAYEVIQDTQKWAYELAASLERSDPRIDEATIYIERFDASQGLVSVRIGIKPIDQDREFNRVFPFFSTDEAA